MSDERLRELERRWRATGALEDEVSYLRQALRAGALRADRAALTAYLGHPAALQAVARLPIPPAGEPGASVLERWGTALEPWGREVHLRAAFAAASTLRRPAPLLVRALDELRLHALDPGRDQVAASALHEEAGAQERGARGRALRSLVLVQWLSALPLRSDGAAGEDAAGTARLLGAALEALRTLGHAEEALRAAVRGALVPWALGRGDPLLAPAARGAS